MADWNTCNAIERHPGKMGGLWVFQGTRIPVYSLFESLIDGATIKQFQAWFPGVKRQQIDAVLQHTIGTLTPSVNPLDQFTPPP